MKNWIVADAEHLDGSPQGRGTRISVALILETQQAHLTPTLSPSDAERENGGALPSRRYANSLFTSSP